MWYEPNGQFAFTTKDGEKVWVNTLTHELPAPGVRYSSCYKPTERTGTVILEAKPALVAAVEKFVFLQGVR